MARKKNRRRKYVAARIHRSKHWLRERYWGPYKLYPHEVIEIRYMCEFDLPRREIAEHFGISTSHVSNIYYGRFWSNL